MMAADAVFQCALSNMLTEIFDDSPGQEGVRRIPTGDDASDAPLL